MSHTGTQSKTQIFGRLCRCAPWFAAIAMLTCPSGCGNGLSSVSGTVTLDGLAIEGSKDVRGTVYFYPEGGGTSGVGELDEAGRYTLSMGSTKGIRPGRYTVAVSATRIIRPTNPDAMPSGKPITPPRYASAKESGLTAEVQPGSNTFDLPLTSAH